MQGEALNGSRGKVWVEIFLIKIIKCNVLNIKGLADGDNKQFCSKWFFFGKYQDLPLLDSFFWYPSNYQLYSFKLAKLLKLKKVRLGTQTSWLLCTNILYTVESLMCPSPVYLDSA